LTGDGIMAMGHAALSDDVIIAHLRKKDKVFDLSADDPLALTSVPKATAVGCRAESKHP
jgi:hypothetical protein